MQLCWDLYLSMILVLSPLKEKLLTFSPHKYLIREQIRGIEKWEVSRVAWDEDHGIRFELSSLGKGERRQVHVSYHFEPSLRTYARCRCRMLESQLIPCLTSLLF
jgi:hypothetical protein